MTTFSVDSTSVITLGSQSFNTGIPDTNGFIWWAQVDGWGSAPVVPRGVPLELRYGEFFQSSNLGPRQLTLTGFVEGSSSTALKTARDQLILATALLTGLDFLTVNDPVPTKSAVYLRNDGVKFDILADYNMAKFQVSLQAPDPRRYSVSPTTVPLGSSTTVTTVGNVRSNPVLTVLGTTTAPILLTSQGLTVWLNLSQGPADSLTVDFGSRSVIWRGVNHYELLDNSTQWWSLQPGANAVLYSGGGSTVTLSWFDAYI